MFAAKKLEVGASKKDREDESSQMKGKKK